MNKSKSHIKIFNSGYCVANSKHGHPKEPSRKIRFYATWVLIQHPELGNIIFDTGYSSRFFEGTRNFPARIYRWVTPVTFEDRDSCYNLLDDVTHIDHVVISHFHADHIGGLKDFKKIPIWCTKKELDFAESRNSLNGVFKGILTNQIPADLEQRAKHPESECPVFNLESISGWSWTKDIHFIYLPGHSIGQIGLLIQNTTIGDVLLCADATWSRKAIKEKIYPSKIVSLFIDSYVNLKSTIDDLHAFHHNYPEVLILPTHCIETANLAENQSDF